MTKNITIVTLIALVLIFGALHLMPAFDDIPDREYTDSLQVVNDSLAVLADSISQRLIRRDELVRDLIASSDILEQQVIQALNENVDPDSLELEVMKFLMQKNHEFRKKYRLQSP